MERTEITIEQFENATQIEVIDADNWSIVYEKNKDGFIVRQLGTHECTRCQVCATPHYSGLPSCDCDENDLSQYQKIQNKDLEKIVFDSSKTVYYS